MLHEVVLLQLQTAARTSAGASLHGHCQCSVRFRVSTSDELMAFCKLGMIEVLLVFNSTPLLFED